MVYFKLRFIAQSGFVSSAIRGLTGSLFSHVEIETDAGTWVGAHLDGGIQNRPRDYCKPFRDYRYAIPVSEHQHRLIYTSALGDIGKPYNKLAIVGLTFQIRNLNNPHAAICSQWTLEKAEAGALYMLNVAPGWEYRVTPETLHLSPLLRGHRTLAVG